MCVSELRLNDNKIQSKAKVLLFNENQTSTDGILSSNFHKIPQLLQFLYCRSCFSMKGADYVELSLFFDHELIIRTGRGGDFYQIITSF